jgi:hypothetical protein
MPLLKLYEKIGNCRALNVDATEIRSVVVDRDLASQMFFQPGKIFVDA